MAKILPPSEFNSCYGSRFGFETVALERYDETNMFALFDQMKWGVEEGEWIKSSGLDGDVCIHHEEIYSDGREVPQRSAPQGLFPSKAGLIGHRMVFTFSNRDTALAFKMRWK